MRQSVTKPRLLDLYCGAGGAAKGYADAGWDVYGVDLYPQPHYPYDYFQGDALTFNWAGMDFQAIHASPPCHDFSRLSSMASRRGGTGWMLDATRTRLESSGLPWVIENVPGAPMRPDYRLCGCMMGLPRLRRERWFETSWGSTQKAFIHDHTTQTVNVSGGGSSPRERERGIVHLKADWEDAMGIDWMTRDELSQAIPPAYTTFMGRYLRVMVDL